MNRLKKRAWGDFRRICGVTILLSIGLSFIVFLDIEGGVRHLPSTLLGIGIVLGFALYAKLRANENDVKNYLQFDEREFHLFRKSQDWGNLCFIAYMSVAMMVVFSLVGSRGMVAVWSLPLMLVSGVLLSETVRFIVLMHYLKEDDKNTKEGPA